MQLHSGIDRDLNCITFTGDQTGYAVGGERYDKGDILKTTDGGVTWIAMNDSLPKALYKIFVVNHDTAFVAAYEGKVYKTTDAGISWLEFQEHYWIPLADIFFTDDHHGIMCGGTGFGTGVIATTEDCGQSWHADSLGNELSSLCFVNSETGFASGYGIILKTNDAGLTWNPTSAEGDFFVSLFFTDDVTGFALGLEGTLLKTTDGGATWKRLMNGNALFNTSNEFHQIIFRDSNNGYIIGDKIFWKTTDAGEHWSKIKTAPDVDIKSIYLNASGGFICGAGGVIYRFED